MQVDGFVGHQAYDNAEDRNAVGATVAGRSLGGVQLSIRTKVEEIMRSQEKLSRTRQDLLVERSRIRSRAEDVRSQRIKTGNAAGSFMTLLRTFFNENRELFPSSIIKAYEEVVQERDRLGSTEDDYSQAEENYLQAERSLGGKEWLFMEEERFLYQYQLPDLFNQTKSIVPHSGSLPLLPLPLQLPPPPPPPPHLALLGNGSTLVRNAPPPPLPSEVHRSAYQHLDSPDHLRKSLISRDIEHEYQSAVSDLAHIRRKFDSLRPYQSELLEQAGVQSRRGTDKPIGLLGPPSFRKTWSDVLDELSECEVRVQNLRQEKMQMKKTKSEYNRRASDPPHVYDQSLPSFDTITRAQTDGIISSLYGDAAVQFRIREWSIGRIRNSAMEKNIYMNILAKEGIPVPDRASLDECPGKYWPSESMDMLPSFDDIVDGSLETNEASLNPSHQSPSRPATEPSQQHPYFGLDQQLSKFQETEIGRRTRRLAGNAHRSRSTGEHEVQQ